MKNKIVLWATKENNEKILLALELVADEDKVTMYTFSEALATEEFCNKMMNLWRNGTDIPFPEGYETIARELSMTEDLLPENIKVERTDIINRAKTEWHFTVLSSKMYMMYRGEIEDMKDRVSNLTKFDSGIWEELKGFWSKVQGQVRERNLFRDHGNELRESTNGLFEQLKNLRKSLDDEFRKKSKTHMSTFMDKLTDVESKIEQGLGLQPLFDKLKKLQNEFKDIDFTKEDRRKIWKRLDGAFKTVKEKKFGGSDGGSKESSALARVDRRRKGLMEAIVKMERSIQRDRKDKEYQDRQIATTDSQLEMQLKQAKVQMINERLSSKQIKLDDMLKTKGELDKRVEIELAKEEQRKEKARVEAAKAEIKAKIATDIEKEAEERNAESDKLEKAAQDIADAKGKKKKPAAAVTEEASKEPTEPIAVADLVSPAVVAASAIAVAPVAEEPADAVVEATPVAETIAEDKVEAVAEKTKEAVSEGVKAAEDAAESFVDKIEDVVEAGAGILSGIIDAIEDKVEDLVEQITGDEEE